MKVKLLVDPSNETSIKEELTRLGIEIDENAEYELVQRSKLHYLQAKKRESIFYIDIKDIIYIESLGHDVIIHTKEDEYKAVERLKTLSSLLNQEEFLRISNSVIIAISHIQKIEASLFQKFILHLDNGDKVDVTRSYYYIFKDRIGI